MAHVEAVFGEDPFARCGELMRQFGVAVCVTEQLPNVNDARRLANAHRGRVFLAGYADLRDDMMVWGDDLSRSDRRTAESDRSRYTVTLNQYKAMQMALYRVPDRFCLFPDPALLEQDVFEDGRTGRIVVLASLGGVLSAGRCGGLGPDCRATLAEFHKINDGMCASAWRHNRFEERRPLDGDFGPEQPYGCDLTSVQGCGVAVGV